MRKRRRRRPLRPQHHPTASAPCDQQVDVTGTVKAFTLTPIGEIEGVILTNGTEIHVPPHLTEQVVSAVRLGEAVAVRGWNTGMPNFIVATALTGQRGQSVVDQGPPPPGLRPPPPPPGQAAPGAQMALYKAGSCKCCMARAATRTELFSTTGQP